MRRSGSPTPPQPNWKRQVQHVIVRAMVVRTLLVYVLFALSLTLLARPGWQAFSAGALIVIAGVVGAAAFAYLLAGGVLCATYVSQLSRWPSPGPPCTFRGGWFVCTWLWSAPRVLVELSPVRFARSRP
jgi:hypothetical protein